MLQSAAPSKIIVPFAQNDSARVNIPVTTTDATRASQSLGFPPLTGQPPEAGGVPPQLEDFNGAMNQIASIAWWVMGGNFYPYDATFAGNSNIGGYANGARLLRSDNLGDWINTVDNNTTNPDATNGTAANWLPGYTYGVSTITVSSAAITLTPAQAAKSTLILTGTLGANTTITLPSWTYDWTIVNNTAMVTFTLLVITSGGTGVFLRSGEQRVRGDGTNIVQSAESIAAATTNAQPPQVLQIQTQAATVAAVSGTAPNYVATLSPAVAGASIPANLRFTMTFGSAGTYGSNTINVGVGGAIPVKQLDSAGNLQPANIPAGLTSDVMYNGSAFVLLNPLAVPVGVVGTARNVFMSIPTASATATLTADEIVVSNALGGMAYKLGSFSKTINVATTGAGGMDTGTVPANGVVAIYAIYNPTTGASALLATNASTLAPNVYGGANMPSGYTASALVSVWLTAASLLSRGLQAERTVSFVPIRILTLAGTNFPSFTLLNTTSVPVNAKRLMGTLNAASAGTGGSTTFTLASDVNGIGTTYASVGGVINWAIVPFVLDLMTAQTLYYKWVNTNTGVPSLFIDVAGYVF